MRVSIAYLLLALLPSVTNAQPAPPSPAPPPGLHVINDVVPEKGHAIVNQIGTRIEERLVTEKVMLNGMVVDVTKTVRVPAQFTYQTLYDIAASRVITPDGRQLPIDEVWKHLKKDSVVAISADFNMPAAPFLRALNPQTLVIIPAPPKKEPAPK
jgi:hypothetical protein